jgi:hypothetical protein
MLAQLKEPKNRRPWSLPTTALRVTRFLQMQSRMKGSKLPGLLFSGSLFNEPNALKLGPEFLPSLAAKF